MPTKDEALRMALDELEALEWTGHSHYDATCCPSCRALALSESGLASMEGVVCGVHDIECSLAKTKAVVKEALDGR
jgi:hypothetical protein